MRIGNKKVTVFKIKNRRGFAAVCERHLTEGKDRGEAVERLKKALKRTKKRTT